MSWLENWPIVVRRLAVGVEVSAGWVPVTLRAFWLSLDGSVAFVVKPDVVNDDRSDGLNGGPRSALPTATTLAPLTPGAPCCGAP